MRFETRRANLLYVGEPQPGAAGLNGRLGYISGERVFPEL